MMERLTFEGNFCDIAQCESTPGGSYCESGSCSQREMWERLKQFEDTGLAPEDCAEYRKFENEIIASGKTFGRLIELLNADKEGRVVVLPCKVGDTVYVSYGEGYRPCVVDRIHVIANNEVQIRARYLVTETLRISASEFGQTVFLTREEAEEALRRAENG